MGSAEQPPVVELVEVAALDPRVSVFRCLDFVDSFVIQTERFTVIVDTLVSPATAAQVVSFLQTKERNLPPLLVVNTHGDWDHSWGNGLFDGAMASFPAPILGHAATWDRFDPTKADAFLRESQRRHPNWYEGVEFRLPSLMFEQSVTIDGGDLQIELIPTPGHTPDHLCLWIPRLSLVLAGDAAELPMPYVGEDSDLTELRSSLAAMMALDPETVLYCHAPGITDGSMISHNIRYFDEAEERIRQLLQSTPEIDAETLSAATLNWPLEAVMPPHIPVEKLADADFYRRSHDQALRAMARWLQRESRLR